MRTWLCPVKPKSWRITKRENLIGVSSIGRKLLEHVSAGDYVICYVLNPGDGVVAVCQAVSPMFFDKKDFWGPNRFPYRIRVRVMAQFSPKLPLSHFLGRIGDKREFEIVPYMRGVEIVELIGTVHKKVIELVEDVDAHMDKA